MQNKTGDLWFSEALQQWYKVHKRELPWRETRDPYRIWISEIILQQTRVEQGLPYYHRFIEAFEDVHALAKAREDEVLTYWQGLGYYSRARNLHTTAKTVSSELKGRFPDSYAALLKLKGVGPYTASAIASFCYGLPHAVVDGNVFRVLSRVFEVDDAINTSSGQRYFTTLANSLIDPNHPDLHNQAIMEFGALQCTPKSPDCPVCPIRERCAAFAKGRVDQLPIKEKKVKIKKRALHYFSVEDAQLKHLIIKRPNTGLWSGLYEFPSIELELGALMSEAVVTDLFGAVKEWAVINVDPLIHKLSHQELYVYVYRVQLDTIHSTGVERDAIQDYPLSALMQKLLKRLNFYYL